jgi:hypothetical protein
MQWFGRRESTNVEDGAASPVVEWQQAAEL